jgi:hypothetical protein
MIRTVGGTSKSRLLAKPSPEGFQLTLVFKRDHRCVAYGVTVRTPLLRIGSNLICVSEGGE